jgi:lipopolysaccharide/colanic/teichoic acid biosynthesis glycosyltransferase/ribosomal protein S18 acetylase RimI-like enzyme
MRQAHLYHTIGKRVFDLLLVIPALVILSPVLGVIALLIRFKLGSPVVFYQQRPGMHGRPFTVLKFRSMQEAYDPAGHLLPDAERITPLGQFLRRTSLDELPELFNILKGEMSLVGPRPLLMRYLPYYTERERKRFDTLPGLTGWAQVNGRNDLPWDQRLAMDVWYVENLSCVLDIKILLLTVAKIWRRDQVQVVPNLAMPDLDEWRRRRPAAIVYRPIRRDECLKVVQVHHAAFPPEFVKRTIYDSPNVERYLAGLVFYPQWRNDHVLWGAWDGETLVGYAHYRALPDSWHLNNIAILPTYQGLGIGRALWNCFLEMGQERGFAQLSLDAERDNQQALAWYQRMGLSITETVWVYEKRLNGETGSHQAQETVELLDWEAAEAWQQTYGFSRFRLAYQGHTWSVERVGRKYFRVRESCPAVLESVLSQIDPTRCLLILSTQPIYSAVHQEVGVSFRLVGQATGCPTIEKPYRCQFQS